jgi:flagellar hook-associated protein 1 FlgK
LAGFSGINVALQTLMAQQAALEITQNNVSNANTAGYHRQQAVLKAGYPTGSMAFTNSSGVQNIGTGVYVSSIERFSVDFYDTQYRNQLSNNTFYSMLTDMLSEIEINLGDASSDSLATRINNFYSGWQTVATDPDIAANRQDLLETASSLVEGFHDRATSLIQLQQDQNLGITQRVDDINDIAKQLAELNAQIGRTQTATTQPNALLDERDRLLDKLTQNIGATIHVQDDGQVLVSVHGHAMVIGSRTFELEAEAVGSKNLVQISWEDSPAGVYLKGDEIGGEIGGLLYARDTVIEDQLASLDDTVTSLVNRVNAIHRSGYNMVDPVYDNSTIPPTVTNLDAITGIDFFSSKSTSVSLSGNLNRYANIGDTYNIAVDVRDGAGVSHQVELVFTKSEANAWTYTTSTPGASILSGDPPTAQPGTVTFDASGNFVSNSGSILYGTATTSVGLSKLTHTGGNPTALSIENQYAALNIQINSLITDYRYIAAATVIDAPGDGNNALAIANSVDTITTILTNGRDPVAESGKQSISHFNTSRITSLALEQRHAETGVADTASIMTAMDDQREAVSGVNLDEEAVNMVKYQRAYQAAARLMNTFDEMLELVVTSLGLVGR